jgi:hypothetical protein
MVENNEFIGEHSPSEGVDGETSLEGALDFMPDTLHVEEQAASLLARQRRQQERDRYEAATAAALKVLSPSWRLEGEVIEEVANKVSVDEFTASEAVGNLVLRRVAQRNLDGKVRLSPS